jgi:type IX secretion system PorP/SprF family membrane protein
MNKSSVDFFRLFVIFCCYSYGIFAQEAPVYKNHVSYEQFVNPAITGQDRYAYLNFSYRRDWGSSENSNSITAIGGSLRLGAFNFYTNHKLLNKNQMISKKRMGFGDLMMYEQNGPIRTYYNSLTFAYFIPFDKSSMTELSFGFLGQIMKYSVNGSLLDQNKPSDLELLKLEQKPLITDGGAGVFFHTKQFQIGASSNELFETALIHEDDSTYINRRDYFLQTGYKFYLHYFDIEPFIYLAQIDNNPIYYYTQFKIYYRNYNWFSIAYKSSQSLVLSMGIRIKRISLGYSFEQKTNNSESNYCLTHQIMVGYNIGFFEPEGLRKTARQ